MQRRYWDDVGVYDGYAVSDDVVNEKTCFDLTPIILKHIITFMSIYWYYLLFGGTP